MLTKNLFFLKNIKVSRLLKKTSSYSYSNILLPFSYGNKNLINYNNNNNVGTLFCSKTFTNETFSTTRKRGSSKGANSMEELRNFCKQIK